MLQPFSSVASGRVGFSKMMFERSRHRVTTKRNVGVQLWSVREDAQRDLAGTLRALSEMGYQGVELAGTYGVAPEEWARLLKETGLHPIGAHVGLDAIAPDKRAATFEMYHRIGCRYLVVPALPPDLRKDAAGYARAAELINDAAGAAKAVGFRLGYHNHAFEFEPLPDGRVPYDVLTARFLPEIFLEMDLGWVAFARRDPSELIRRYPGRLVLVHVKAFSATNEKAVLGEDDVPWAEVLKVCAQVGGTEWYIVEHERYANPPMVCVKQCADYLLKLSW